MTIPPLRSLPLAQLADLPVPTLKIKSEEDIRRWKTTIGYADYIQFLQRLANSVVGLELSQETPLRSEVDSINRLIDTLQELDNWVAEIPPMKTPQRFGNLAFRTWGRRLDERTDSMLSDLLPSHLHPAIPQLKPYWLTSFGSFTRMDYGTGHETSFAVFLCVLTLIGYFSDEKIETIERDLVLLVFLRYLRLCWHLQDAYNLEPAGSHGVWGLDDSHFLPYMFGSAQLREQTSIPVSAVLQKPLPPTNFYFLAISRINQVKKGPFHEHSSQLYSIATQVLLWPKVEKGLGKMYEAEVLGKRVVVQHLPLGGALAWDPDTPDSTPVKTSVAKTDAPWAQTSR